MTLRLSIDDQSNQDQAPVSSDIENRATSDIEK